MKRLWMCGIVYYIIVFSMIGCNSGEYCNEYTIGDIACKTNDKNKCIIKLERQGYNPTFVHENDASKFRVGQKVIMHTTHDVNGERTETLYIQRKRDEYVWVNPATNQKLIMKNGKRINTLETKVDDNNKNIQRQYYD